MNGQFADERRRKRRENGWFFIIYIYIYNVESGAKTGKKESKYHKVYCTCIAIIIIIAYFTLSLLLTYLTLSPNKLQMFIFF